MKAWSDGSLIILSRPPSKRCSLYESHPSHESHEQFNVFMQVNVFNVGLLSFSCSFLCSSWLFVCYNGVRHCRLCYDLAQLLSVAWRGTLQVRTGAYITLGPIRALGVPWLTCANNTASVCVLYLSKTRNNDRPRVEFVPASIWRQERDAPYRSSILLLMTEDIWSNFNRRSSIFDGFDHEHAAVYCKDAKQCGVRTGD